MKTAIKVDFNVSNSNIENKISLSGRMSVSEEIAGELDLVLEVNKCTLDMKNCEKSATVNVREICKKFKDKNAFYYSVFSSIKPQLQCPIKAGNYSSEQSTIELSMISLLPLDGYIWLVTRLII